MALGSLLTLLDDITVVLDDVALMTKVAAKKTAGVLGDDLAVNAEKVLGVRPERELPIVWGVAKGSMMNKLILVPSALLISIILPALITPLLVCGGLYLCFEGAEKLVHSGLAGKAQHDKAILTALNEPSVDITVLERERIRGAVRTDFILSAEIIVLTLGVVAGEPLLTQVVVMSGIAALMTVGVYGLVAAIVKLDDLGVLLLRRESSGRLAVMYRWLGQCLVDFSPWLMRALSVVGTIAMFLVGGGILLHAVHPITEWVEHALVNAPISASVVLPLFGGLVGVIAGGFLVGAEHLIRGRSSPH